MAGPAATFKSHLTVRLSSITLPVVLPDDNEECNENNFVAFGTSVADSICVRVVDPQTFANDCESIFGAAR